MEVKAKFQVWQMSGEPFSLTVIEKEQNQNWKPFQITQQVTRMPSYHVLNVWSDLIFVNFGALPNFFYIDWIFSMILLQLKS